jgi:alpha-galactosidase
MVTRRTVLCWAFVLANATYLKDKLLAHGWNYIVIDFRWYDHALNRLRTGAKLATDEFGRMVPAENRFPSSAGGKGFKPLADKLHAMGLKFGFHYMRGMPRQAVQAKTPIADSNFTAADAGNTGNTCGWCPDMYGVRDNAAGQAWYDAMFKLYASWGLDYIKVDDLSNPYRQSEVEMIRRAIDKCGRSIVLSTSAGPMPTCGGSPGTSGTRGPS